MKLLNDQNKNRVEVPVEYITTSKLLEQGMMPMIAQVITCHVVNGGDHNLNGTYR